MADIKLFNIKGNVKEIKSGSVDLERHLQNIIEQNMSTFFGVTFLASEYRTTGNYRIDSIGIDENNSPVIFEYKRNVNENVINQGCFYLDWLLNHKDSFKLLVLEKLKKRINIDWSAPRVICIAADFTVYDAHAINQMNRNISLIRYRKFGDDLLMFEHVNEANNETNLSHQASSNTTRSRTSDHNFEQQYKNASPEIKLLFEDLKNYMSGLGDDVYANQSKLYYGFKKIMNIVCVVLTNKQMKLYLKLDASTVKFEPGFSRSLKGKGHWGTGDVEVIIKDRANFEKAKALIDRAYKEN